MSSTSHSELIVSPTGISEPNSNHAADLTACRKRKLSISEDSGRMSLKEILNDDKKANKTGEMSLIRILPSGKRIILVKDDVTGKLRPRQMMDDFRENMKLRKPEKYARDRQWRKEQLGLADSSDEEENSSEDEDAPKERDESEENNVYNREESEDGETSGTLECLSGEDSNDEAQTACPEGYQTMQPPIRQKQNRLRRAASAPEISQ